MGYWVLAIGYGILAIGYWVLAIGDWQLAIGYWIWAALPLSVPLHSTAYTLRFTLLAQRPRLSPLTSSPIAHCLPETVF